MGDPFLFQESHTEVSMRVLLTACGSTGDVLPFMALGRALMSRGHSATLALPSTYRTLAARLGMRFVACGPTIESDGLRQGVARLRRLSLDRQIRLVDDFVQQNLSSTVDILEAECANADVVVGPFHQTPSIVASRSCGVPLASVMLAPLACRGGYASQLSYNVVPSEARGDACRILAVSRAMVTGADIRPSGFLYLDVADDLPSDVESFLCEGPPPVLVTFGSMVQDVLEVYRIVARAAVDAATRVLLQFPWNVHEARVLGLNTNANVFACGRVAHDRLLSRCAAAVHHAGAGTTAATIRYGLPSVPVPHILDQYYWASRLMETGCAPCQIPRGDLTGKVLGWALRRVLEEPCWRASAQALARVVAEERGTEVAADLVESIR